MHVFVVMQESCTCHDANASGSQKSMQTGGPMANAAVSAAFCVHVFLQLDQAANAISTPAANM
jgi:hypothetical protein